MSRAERNREALRRLRDRGSMATSKCSAAFLRLVAPLLDSGVLGETRVGAGRHLTVRDPAAFRRFLDREFPDQTVPEDTPQRIADVARYRDSKAGPGEGPEVVLARVWDEGALQWNGRSAGAAAVTAAHGVFAFVPGPRRVYTVLGRAALVENPAAFLAMNPWPVGVKMAILVNGSMPGRMLDWLAGPAGDFATWLHLPDYDPAGLIEYERLRCRLGPRIELYLPPDLPRRFAEFSNRNLLKKTRTQSMLNRLRRSELPEVRTVVNCIDCYGAGLEQEALFLADLS